MLYEFSSAAANNGSGFEGLGDNTPFWNIATGLVMLLGRYIPIIAPLALAGSLAAKQAAPERAGSLRADSATFGFSLWSVVIILGLLDVHAGRRARPDRRAPGDAVRWRMRTEIKRGILYTVVTMALFGGAYPLLMLGIGRVVFPRQAEGSLIRRADGTVVGSTLIAQKFERPEYFQPRPSAVDYNAASTGGSNYGPSNPDHLKAVRERLDAVVAREGVAAAQVPSEMVDGERRRPRSSHPAGRGRAAGRPRGTLTERRPGTGPGAGADRTPKSRRSASSGATASTCSP